MASGCVVRNSATEAAYQARARGGVERVRGKVLSGAAVCGGGVDILIGLSSGHWVVQEKLG